MSQMRHSEPPRHATRRKSLTYLFLPFGTSLAVIAGKPAKEPDNTTDMEGKMIALTENAAEAIRNAIGATSKRIAGLRVTALAAGCSGYQYQMGLVENSDPGDLC